MFHICYTSYVPDMSRDDFYAIVERAHTRNTELRIGGEISFCDSTIVQIIEGKEISVIELFQRIRVDRQHQDVTLVASLAVRDRNFETFGMCVSDPLTIAMKSLAIATRSGHGRSSGQEHMSHYAQRLIASGAVPREHYRRDAR